MEFRQGKKKSEEIVKIPQRQDKAWHKVSEEEGGVNTSNFLLSPSISQPSLPSIRILSLVWFAGCYSSILPPFLAPDTFSFFSTLPHELSFRYNNLINIFLSILQRVNFPFR